MKSSWVLKKLGSMPFACKEDAAFAFKKRNKGIRYHDIELVSINELPHYAGKGRPKKEVLPERIDYHVETIAKKMKKRSNQLRNKVHVML